MLLRTIDKVIERYVIKAIAVIAIVILLFFMMLTVTDVALRYIFNHPLLGSMEIIKTSMVILSFLVLGWTTHENGHVRIDTVYLKFKATKQWILDVLFTFLSTFLMTFMTYSFIKETLYRFDIGERTQSLKIPIYLIYLLTDVGLVVTCAILLLQLVMLATRRAQVRHES